MTTSIGVVSRSRSVEILNQPPGTSVTFGADWSPFVGSVSVQIGTKPASNLEVVAIDHDVDEFGSLIIRVACSFTDSDFSPLVSFSQCFVRLTANSGESATGTCNRIVSGKPCVASVTLSPTLSMLRNGSLTLEYGLTNAYGSTAAQEVMAYPPTTDVEAMNASISVEDNFVVYLPSRELYPGETFSVTLVARGDSTVAFAKFA
jgi:hypothetical protein